MTVYSCWDVIRLCAVLMTVGCWRHILHRWHQLPRIWLIYPVSLKDRPACRHGALGLWDHNACSLISCIDVQPTTNKTQSHNSIMTARLCHMYEGISLLECVCVCVMVLESTDHVYEIYSEENWCHTGDVSYCFESKLLQGSIGINKCNYQMLYCLYFGTNVRFGWMNK